MEEQEKHDREVRSRVAALKHDQGFKEWRALAVDPVIEQIELQLQRPLELSEANLKALVMYRNMAKGLFYQLFEELDAQQNLENQ